MGQRFGPDREPKRDMLGAFVRNGVSQRQCETEVMFQIIAGSDTTATAIRATMLYLMTTPHAYNRLQREIDDTIAAGRASMPIKAEEGREMKYLQVRKLHLSPLAASPRPNSPSTLDLPLVFLSLGVIIYATVYAEFKLTSPRSQ